MVAKQLGKTQQAYHHPGCQVLPVRIHIKVINFSKKIFGGVKNAPRPTGFTKGGDSGRARSCI
jgi:hypothetical protein